MKQINIKKYSFIALIVFGFLFTIYGAFAETIEGDKVFINDSNVYLSANPHTLTNADQTIYLELLSKAFTGQINVVFGYNDTNIRPKTFEVKTTVLNGSGQLEEVWNNIAPSSSLINYNYQGMTSWRYITGLNIQNQTNYNARIKFEQIPSDWGKYWFCVYPTSYGTNIGLANSNGHLYCLDPWYNISLGYTINISNLDTGLIDGWTLQNATSINKTHNLTVTGGSFTTTNCKIDGCYSQTGATNRGTFTPTGFPSGNANRTFSCWVNTTQTAFQLFFMYGDGGGNARFAFGTNAGQYYYSGSGGGADFQFGDATNIVNKWVMITLTHNGTHIKTYQNNTLINTTARTLGTSTTGGRIGNYEADNGGLIGNIDECYIWNRELNSSEITQLYNNGYGLSYRSTLTYSTFTIQAYNNVTNTTINNFNATINGMFFNTTTGVLATNITNSSVLLNINVSTIGYNDYIVNNYNFSSSLLLNVYLQPQPPTAPSINSPYNNLVVNQFLNITYNQSTLVTGSIMYYNITLLNSNGSLKQILRGNNSLNTSFYWNIYDSNLSLGNYKVMVEALDTNGLKVNDTHNITVLNNATSLTALGGVSGENSTLYLVLSSSANITNVSLNYSNSFYTSPSSTNYGSYIVYSQNVFNNISGLNAYTWNVSVMQLNGTLQYFLLNSSLLVNPLNLTINLYDENTGLQLKSFNTSILLQNIDTNQQFTLNNNVSQFNFTNLSSGSYYVSITPSNTSYYNRVYNVVINGSNPTSMNAYIGVGSQVVLSYSDVDSGDALENVLVTMYRTINSSVVSVESRYTDITGRVQFTYTSNIAYDFFSVKQGYNSLTYPLNPVLFSSYNIKMTKTDTLPSGYDDVNVYYTPQSFDCDNMYNFVWSILSNEQLTGYAFAFTNVTFIGNTPSGQTVINPINISCAGGMQWVTLYYNYTTDNNVSRQFSKTFFISGTKPATSYTFAQNKVNDYGMGWFERLVVITIIVICVTGVASLLVGGVGGLVVGLLTLGYFANMFTISKFVIAFTIIIGVLITISRMKEQ